jgi:Asp-tRNA(Asn)/Glu-tRNA(Gln) amidotransferase A subunit family amidase
MLRATTRFDVVMGPVVADLAPMHRQLVGEDYVFTLAWSLTGWPALSLPFGVDLSTGLPLAVQIAAPRLHDHVVLAIAAALEKSIVPTARAEES